jgi:hypothetical protein
MAIPKRLTQRSMKIGLIFQRLVQNAVCEFESSQASQAVGLNRRICESTMDALLLVAPTTASIGYDGRGDFARVSGADATNLSSKAFQPSSVQTYPQKAKALCCTPSSPLSSK